MWMLVVALLAGLAFSAGAATYETVEDLPEPGIVILDSVGDAEDFAWDRGAPIGWYDLREIHGYITEQGVAFAVFCNGNILSDSVLLVLMDVDGRGGAIGRGTLNRNKILTAGYDYALGILGDSGLFTVGTAYEWNRDREIEQWIDGRVAYFEVTWEQIGGRPEEIALLIAAEQAPYQDRAPDRGKAVLEIPPIPRNADLL